MAKNYSDHSRFFFSSYQEIQDYINAEQINQWDIVLCKDTQEFILVTDQFELVPIKSRVYRFNSVTNAEAFLNEAKDSYQGQLVSILNTSVGSYQAYIVNKNNAGRYYVTPISVYNVSDIDYNLIGNRPIEQVGGNIENPVILSELSDGLYKIEGAYKISSRSKTIYQSYNGDLLSVTHNDEDDTDGVKIITSSSITDYVVDNRGNIIDKGEYITKQWIESKGYMSSDDLDAKLEALNIITKDDAVYYIQELVREGTEEIVNELFDDTFNARFDQRIRETLIMEEQQNIQKLFN